MSKKLKGSIMLLITALIWGSAFVAQSEGMRYIEPFTYNALRTLLGGVFLLPIIFLFRKYDNKKENSNKNTSSKKVTIFGGLSCGVFLFIASSLQQSGISLTTAGKAGFITALYIIFVPLIQLLLYRKLNVIIWICVFIAAVGFYLLCINEGFHIGKGDWLILCCALFFAIHIITIDYFNNKNADPMIMSCIQFFTAGFLMLLCMIIFESPSLKKVSDAKYTILYAGIISSGIAYTLQIIGQRYTPPATATLLMSLESVFAALSGWLILNETLSEKELIGCTFVFIAVILAQFKAPEYNNSD